MSDHEASVAPWLDAEACELTIRGTPLRATTGSSQASAPRFSSLGQAVELAGLVCPQGCGPAQPAASPAGGPVASAQTDDTTSWKDHEFRNPSPPAVSQRKERRRIAYELRDGLRPLGMKRVAACGRRRIAHEVEVVRRTAKRESGQTYRHAYYRGLLRCGSVWECPVCALQIRAERADELKSAVLAWGGDNVAMLSLTVRHALGHDLRATRRGLSEAFQRLIRGKPWKQFSRKYGVEHHVRAVEVTHGVHGWHPHVHALLFLETPLSAAEHDAATTWLRERWRNCVERAIGSDFAPNDRGVDLRESKRADYLAKFSFELVDPGTKRGRGKNRTPLQIATSAAKGRCPDDEALWVAYCAGMRGAKMLTWSKGLRAAVDLDIEKSDGQVVEGEEQQEAEIVAVISAGAWDGARDRHRLPCAILEAAERAVGQAEGYEAIENLLRVRGAPWESSA
jgi:hypothetical protein